jgi:hypothetical protein
LKEFNKNKNKNMNLSIKELNELIYSLGITASKGIFVNKDVNASLIDKMYNELNKKIADEAIDEEVDEFTDELLGGDLEFSSHYVSNNEANEDFLSTLAQDAQRYEDSHMTRSFPIVDPFTSVSEDYDNHLSKLKQRGYITQALLDYVDRKGAVSHGDLERYYKSITGSNSFSHILDNLRTPYKNRKTQRYIAKEGKRYSDAKYIIKVANPYNWVVIDDNDEFSNL